MLGRREDDRTPELGLIMFEKLMATAVLPATDLDRAKRWWHDVLDRDPVEVDVESGNVFYDVGGTVVLVYLTGFAGTAQNTALNLVTDDIERDAAALRARGAVSYTHLTLPTICSV